MEKKGIVSNRCEINRQIKADNALLRELKATVKKLMQAVKNTIPAIAEAMEKIRRSMLIFSYQLRHIGVGQHNMGKRVKAVNSYAGAYHFEHVGYTSPERYAIFNIKESSDVFSGSIVTCQNTGSNENMVVMIYVDDVLKYTSPQFGKTTEKIDFSVDVSGGQKITIKAGLASGRWSDACFSFVNVKLS